MADSTGRCGGLVSAAMLRPLLALAALFALALPAAAQPLSAEEQQKIDAAVAESLQTYQVPAASVAVVRDGKIVLAKAYGKASEKLPVARADMPFQIASNSKQFTAAALLLLEDEGKLSLDDTVAKYLPGISGGERIKLRQLLSHTAGLQDYWPQDYSFAAMARPVTPQGIVDVWAKKPLDFEPGTKWQYSNTAYVVAGMIAEKVSGEPLLSFLQRRIFKPLSMSSVMDQDLAIGAKYPQGYGRAALGPVRPVTPPARGWLYAAGELSMTAEDLAKWDIARMDRALLPKDDWEEQERTVKLTDGTDTGYGLGVFARTRDGRLSISHTGEAVGFLSTNTVYPKERTAIVVLTNSWSGGAFTDISKKIAAIVLPASAATSPEQAEDAATLTRARALYDGLVRGELDRAQLTEDLAFYFTPQVRSDYRTSLSPLGTPTSFTQEGAPVLRGGFVIRSYKVVYRTRTLRISSFTEPGANGRFEQFLVTPE